MRRALDPALLESLEIDPAMRAWIESFLTVGWRLVEIDEDEQVVALDWPRLTSLPALFDTVEVPLRADSPLYAARIAWMSDMLDAICMLGAKIRQAEALAYAIHVANGLPRERPIRWTREYLEKP